MTSSLKQFLHDGAPTARPNPRECGECTACCTVLAVHELQKPNNQACCHLGDRCTIYPLRPDSCRDWSCLWLEGGLSGGERCRPDRLGLVFSLDATGRYPLVTAYEAWSGAAKGARAQYVLEMVSESSNVVLVDPQNQFTVVSPGPAFRAAVTPPFELLAGIDD